MSHTYPRSFSHIGISVPNVEKAVEFYTQVMGWYTIMEPTEILEDKSPIGEMCTEVFGEKWEKFKIAHLSTGDRIGVEIFEFKNQENPKDNFEYWKTGDVDIYVGLIVAVYYTIFAWLGAKTTLLVEEKYNVLSLAILLLMTSGYFFTRYYKLLSNKK